MDVGRRYLKFLGQRQRTLIVNGKETHTDFLLVPFPSLSISPWRKHGAVHVGVAHVGVFNQS
jgi:hypothetical protein